MSEYQRYEWMTSDRPLTRAQLDAVNRLSSHIEASSTHATVEYSWGDFKHDPLAVLRDYFDGFLYWANWGAPRLALRFPHGVLAADLLDGYDFDELVTFTPHPDHDILDIHFAEMEPPDEWTEYELGSLMPLREELMDGDPRPLYIVWLAGQCLYGQLERAIDDADAPPVPPALGALTSAQQALAELLRLPEELLAAAAKHSQAAARAPHEDVGALVALLSPERRDEYVMRLARHEPNLSRLLVKELRELNAKSQTGQADQGANRKHPSGSVPSTGERVPYPTLFAEGQAVRAQRERERRARERLAREQHLRDIHDHPDVYWRQVDEAVDRGSGAGYEQATQALLELRAAAKHFQETAQFDARFAAWVQPHLRRPALIKRLRDQQFAVPTA
jgi:hypothetical protein